MLARAYLALSAVLYLGVGVAFLAVPELLAPVIELDLSSPVARTDVRAVYGGFDLLLGGVCVWALARDQARIGVAAAALGVGALASGRVVGLAIDGIDPINVGFLVAELTFVVLGAVAWRTLDRG